MALHEVRKEALAVFCKHVLGRLMTVVQEQAGSLLEQ